MNLSVLRSQVAYVNQDSKVFSGSISDNIAYGDDAPDLDRTRWAAGLADADGFIQELPNRYDYRLGEGGLGLSGGQKQRLVLARALYRKNKVIILDEATSSLDADSEGVVARNLKEVFHGSTAIIIAHRLSTVRSVDRILVLEEGRVLEEGDHESLMAARGRYFEMVRAGTRT
jgi:ATP-binding cassette subfamily B protein